MKTNDLRTYLHSSQQFPFWLLSLPFCHSEGISMSRIITLLKPIGVWTQHICIGLFYLLVPTLLWGQQPTQKIKGIVQDKQTKQTLVGASILVNKTDIGVVTDENGAFLLEKVPIGRVGIRCQFVGYEPFQSEDIILSSTKEAYFEIELSPQSVEMREVVVSTAKNAFEAVNPLSVVSTRSFTAEETDRIAAGINDPGRIALSFPGVKQGPDETENTIIVRGNSPVGILWRVEGIDVPNPNHFLLLTFSCWL